MREIDEGYLTPHAMIDPAVLEKHCKIIDYSVAVYQIFSKIMLTKFDTPYYLLVFHHFQHIFITTPPISENL